MQQPTVTRLAIALSLRVMLLAILMLGFVGCSPAFAADGTAPPIEHPLVERVFAVLGLAASVLATLATVLPRSWRITQLCARFSADLRGILTPDPSDDPEWLKRERDTAPDTWRGTQAVLLWLVPLTLLGAPGCAFWRDTVAPVAVECAPDRQYVIEGLTAILEGEDAFDVLDRIRTEKGPELVLCALERFLDRVAVSPETARQRTTARAYLDRQ